MVIRRFCFFVGLIAFSIEISSFAADLKKAPEKYHTLGCFAGGPLTAFYQIPNDLGSGLNISGANRKTQGFYSHFTRDEETGVLKFHIRGEGTAVAKFKSALSLKVPKTYADRPEKTPSETSGLYEQPRFFMARNFNDRGYSSKGIKCYDHFIGRVEGLEHDLTCSVCTNSVSDLQRIISGAAASATSSSADDSVKNTSGD